MIAGAAHTVQRLAILLCALVGLSAGGHLHAQNTDTNIRASLLVDGNAVPGETLYVALHFQPVSEEWHGYWRNPGDAGYGMALDWNLPDGWAAGEPLYPVPERLLIGDLMNHVYEGDYAVLVPVTVPGTAASANAGRIGLRARWLACTDQICVPEQAMLSAIVSIGVGGDTDARFAEWQAAIPPLLDSEAQYDTRRGKGGETLRLAIPLPANVSLADPHVYVATPDLVQYSATQNFARNDDLLIVEIPASGSTDEAVIIEGILAFEDGRGVRFIAKPGIVPTGGTPLSIGNDAAPNLGLLFLAALAGGLILNFMPCVFPILSLKALSLARAGGSQSEARKEGIAYTAGVVLACMALGGLMLALRAAGEQVGWAFQLQEPWVVMCLTILAAVITANLAGLFELPSISITRRGEPASAFATGLLAAVAATPCTGPFMAAALGAALLLPVGAALLLFAALGLGLALPFLLIGLVPALRRMLPKPGAWMDRFRKLLAIPMGLTALALIWLVSRLGGQTFALIVLLTLAGILGALLIVGRLQQHGKMAWSAFGLIAAPFLVFAVFALPASFNDVANAADRSLLSPLTYSAADLAQAQASGQPVFLWFTADWCVTCKVNESVAIERDATKAAFEDAGVIAMRGDWTQRDSEITAFLTEQGVAGIPLYIWYPGDGSKLILPQVLTPESLVDLAQAHPAGGIGLETPLASRSD